MENDNLSQFYYALGSILGTIDNPETRKALVDEGHHDISLTILRQATYLVTETFYKLRAVKEINQTQAENLISELEDKFKGEKDESDS